MTSRADKDGLRYLNEDIQWFRTHRKTKDGVYFDPIDKNNPKVSVILLHYGNSVKDTLQALNNLSLNTYPDLDVILVDNNSPVPIEQKDISAKIADKLKIKLIKSPVNLGYCGGNNMATRSSKQRRGLCFPV